MPTEPVKTPVQFDKAACIKKLDEVGKAVIAYKGRPGYDVDAWLKANVLPLDQRLNVKQERTTELQNAILALPVVPTLTKVDTSKPVATPDGIAPAIAPLPTTSSQKSVPITPTRSDDMKGKDLQHQQQKHQVEVDANKKDKPAPTGVRTPAANEPVAG